MPDQAANQPSISKPNQPGKPFLLSKSFLFIIAFLFLTTLFIVVFFNYYSQGILQTSKVVTGLNRDQVKIGINSFSGVFPNNDTPFVADDAQANDVIFDSLVKMRSDQVVPSLATSWTNPDQNTWRFVIRDNVKFTSGDLFNVNDVKYSFDTAIASNANPNTALPSAYETENVKTVKIVDNHTIDVITVKPDPIFLLRMLDFYIFSQSQIKRDGLKNAVGTGPYKVSKAVKDTELDLVANSNYWGDKPKVAQVTYLVFPTDDNMKTAFNKGQIDIGRLRSAKVLLPAGFSEKTFDEPRVLSLMFNFADTKINGNPNPLLKKDVREALKLAIDQNQVIRDASASGRPASQVITKSIFGFNPNITYPKKDIDSAKKLLADNNSTNLKITIYATPDKQQAAQSIADQLSVIGVAAKVEVQPDFGTLVQKVTSGKGEAFVASPQADDGGEYLSTILATDGEQNILTYSNPALDKITSQAEHTFVPKERKALLQQGMAIAMADDPILPLYSQTATFLVRDNFDLPINSIGELHADVISGRAIQNN